MRTRPFPKRLLRWSFGCRQPVGLFDHLIHGPRRQRTFTFARVVTVPCLVLKQEPHRVDMPQFAYEHLQPTSPQFCRVGNRTHLLTSRTNAGGATTRTFAIASCCLTHESKRASLSRHPYYRDAASLGQIGRRRRRESARPPGRPPVQVPEPARCRSVSLTMAGGTFIMATR